MKAEGSRRGRLIAEARAALDVRHLAFGIHDASFPAGDGDPGRGSPHAEGARSLLELVSELGFDVLQLGPQGETSADNPSPYDGAAFSRSTLSIHASSLADEEAGGLLRPADLREALQARPEASDLRADHVFAWRAQRCLLLRAFQRMGASEGSAVRDLRRRLTAFEQREREWLLRDGLYEALRAHHGDRGFRDWPAADAALASPDPDAETGTRRDRALARHRDALAFHAFTQLLAHEQHARLRRHCREQGLRVYGDLQIGLADRDVWAFRHLFLEGYALGAPPSRTNPDGQPWGYPVFDPDLHGDPGDRSPGADAAGGVTALLRARMAHMFEAYDGVRIDHPHGWVCPWIYRTDDVDPADAVARGVRLFSAWGVPGHEPLVRHDVPRPEQIDESVVPWDDHRVCGLDAEQVTRYARLFDEIARAARDARREPDALVCEVLSTLPAPLAAVLDRHGLGRMRVTGKIDPADANDPYRIEAATPPDWVMIGSHDTPPLWRLLESWGPQQRNARAAYSARQLEPDPSRRPAFAETLSREPGLLAQALLAELFASRAHHALVFFTDLFGMTEAYNRPGVVSVENWSLRVPPDFRDVYRERLARRRALDLPLALALALRSRRDTPKALVAALFEEASRAAPIPPALRAAAA